MDGGEIPAAEMKRRVADLERYRRESSGRRRGLRKAEFDYVSYHGDIVDALQKEREARKVEDKKVVNTKLIDLYVSVSGRKTEVFEVKTGIDRQSIYTAVGQRCDGFSSCRMGEFPTTSVSALKRLASPFAVFGWKAAETGAWCSFDGGEGTCGPRLSLFRLREGQIPEGVDPRGGGARALRTLWQASKSDVASQTGAAH